MDKLPLELWEHIFSRIDDMQLARLTRVCKTWQHNLSADIFWKRRTESKFGAQYKVMPGKWKIRYGREYCALVYDMRRLRPPEVFPIRSIVLGELCALIIICLWAWLLPKLALDFLSSPLPALIAWVGMKAFKRAGIKIDRSVPRILALRTYIVSMLVALQAFFAWQLSPSTCSVAVVTGYALLCNAFLIEGIMDSQAELRLLYMLSQWKLMASESMLQVYLFLFAPLDYFSQQAFTRNLFLLAAATKILKPQYLSGTLPLIGAAPVIPRLIKLDCLANGAATEDAAIACAARTSGVLMSLSNAATFIGAPIIGLLSDSLGRRIFLLISTIALACDLLTCALAPFVFYLAPIHSTPLIHTSVPVLYITRPIFGFFNAGYAMTTAYTADLMGPSKRAQAFGILGISLGLGLALGPLITGLLAKAFSVYVSLGIAGAVAALNAGMVYFLKETRTSLNTSIVWSKAIPLRSFSLLWRHPVAFGFTAVFLHKYIADEGIIDTFPLYLDYRFHWDLWQVGVFTSLLGISVAIAQGALIPFLRLLYNERQSLLVALLASSAASYMYALASEGWQMYIVIFFRSVSLISAPLLQALIANEFPAQMLGEVLGLVTSLRNLSAAWGPLIFNRLFAYFISEDVPVKIPQVVFYISSICSLIATILAILVMLSHPEQRQRKEIEQQQSEETIEFTIPDGSDGAI